MFINMLPSYGTAMIGNSHCCRVSGGFSQQVYPRDYPPQKGGFSLYIKDRFFAILTRYPIGK